jgi:hypothetical protein
MAYSVMVWLVDPGEQAHQQQAMQRTTLQFAPLVCGLDLLASTHLFPLHPATP